jgi:hypothetical protein
MENSKVIYLDRFKGEGKGKNECSRLRNKIIQALREENYFDNPDAPSRIEINISLSKSKNNKKTEIFIRQTDE